MNHLSGLSVGDFTSTLPQAALEALSTFRSLHESKAPKELGSDSPKEPTFEVKTEELPSCGWRALDNLTLYRFLAADQKSNGDFCMDKSEIRLQEALVWRKTSGVDKYLSPTEPPPPGVEKYKKLRVRGWVGHDNEGRPVQIERLGEFCGFGNTRAFSDKEWIEFYTWDLEDHYVRMREASKIHQKPIHRLTYLGDLQHIVDALFGIEIIRIKSLFGKLNDAVENHYPEVIDRIILFNAPRIFSSVYNGLVKKFLDPNTAAKVEIHSGVPLERLKEIMPEDVIPVEYGGSNKMDFPHTAKASDLMKDAR